MSESSIKLDEVLCLAEISPTVRLVWKLADSGYKFTGDVGAELRVGIFLLGYVIPCQGEASNDNWVEDAKALWGSWISQKGDEQEEMGDVVGSLVKEKLKSVVVDEIAETRCVHCFACQISRHQHKSATQT